MIQGAEVGSKAEEVGCDKCGRDISLNDATCVCNGRMGKKTTPRYRCKACNSLGVRITRAGWGVRFQTNFTKAGREEFFMANNSLFGAGLKAALQQTIEKSSIEKESELFSAKSVWLDKADLEAKYADKPEQLSNIMKIAKQIEHPTRKVTLYEDIDHAAKNCSVIENEKVQKHSQETQDVVTPAKRQKTDPPASSTAEKPLSPAQSKKCEKWVADGGSAQQNLEKLVGLTAKAEEDIYTGLVPVLFLVAAKTAQMEFQGASELLVACMAEDWLGDFKPVEAAMRDAVRNLQVNANRLQMQMQIADSMRT